MNTAYVLVQCKIAHEMEVLKALLDIKMVKEAKGTFGYYDILTKIEGETSSEIERVITKEIRNIPNVTATTTLSIIPEQDFKNE
jgi:DNA-binding Lrp family transcriptional regulator